MPRLHGNLCELVTRKLTSCERSESQREANARPCVSMEGKGGCHDGTAHTCLYCLTLCLTHAVGAALYPLTQGQEEKPNRVHRHCFLYAQKICCPGYLLLPKDNASKPRLNFLFCPSVSRWLSGLPFCFHNRKENTSLLCWDGLSHTTYHGCQPIDFYWLRDVSGYKRISIWNCSISFSLFCRHEKSLCGLVTGLESCLWLGFKLTGVHLGLGATPANRCASKNKWHWVLEWLVTQSWWWQLVK